MSLDVENLDELEIISEDDLNLLDDSNDQTRTFAINTEKNVISGMIDELDALKQSIHLKLSIEADQYLIYPWTYGLKTLDLIGKPSYYIMAILPDRIKETLSTDNRITDVSDFEFTVNKNAITTKFVVKTIYGDVIEEETVVKY